MKKRRGRRCGWRSSIGPMGIQSVRAAIRFVPVTTGCRRGRGSSCRCGRSRFCLCTPCVGWIVRLAGSWPSRCLGVRGSTARRGATVGFWPAGPNGCPGRKWPRSFRPVGTRCIGAYDMRSSGASFTGICAEWKRWESTKSSTNAGIAI